MNKLMFSAMTVLISSLITLGAFGQCGAPQADPSPRAESAPQAAPMSPSQKAPSPAEAKTAPTPAVELPEAKLNAARTVWVTRAHGSNIPFDTIKSTLEGWVRISVVDTPDHADIVVSVETSGDSDVQLATSATPNDKTGHMDQSSKTSKDLSATEIKLTVMDAKNKRVLWTSTEKVKFAVKKNSKETNLVEAAERLAVRLHDRLEPPSAR